ncbi:uncharacterized protein LOC122053111 [Zingiber officinale]|uniref:Uncharacterized protein n=1 Tax=Zingiber officinale TaxID=94328 RepID=A0A8J5HML6_ZINOF|nr:uncharacterized protein LOC122053111 [Zingiber officinale]KAG6522693.1 hypothetical protein ZIOFF_019844 [Zingiber officinale]
MNDRFRMDDFTAPSFSLGLDFDIADLSTEDEEGNDNGEEERRPLFPVPSPAVEDPSFERFPEHGFVEGEPSGHEEIPASEAVQETPLPAFKRLRRGPPRPPSRRIPSPIAHSPICDDGGTMNGDISPEDDDIEAFSSPEDNPSRDQYSSVRSHITGRSSKCSLQKNGILTNQSTMKLNKPRITTASEDITSTVSHENCNKIFFQNSNISPLRKIYLLSSDSDNPLSDDECKYNKIVDANRLMEKKLISKNQQHKSLRYEKSKKDSFWEDLSPKKSISLSTPALDQFCEDYFKSTKDLESGRNREEDMVFCSSRVTDTKRQRNIIGNAEQNCNLPNAEPPSFQYFYHNDLRIQMLVKQRLPYFVPLGTEVQKQLGTRNINYMNQFGARDTPSDARKTSKQDVAGSSKKRRKAKDANLKEPNASGGWACPKKSAVSVIPKDAGKRRVHASGHQSGHWFTDESGRKVYVTKDGVELSGQQAYRQYRKESGAGFRKSKKKAATKRKMK